LLLSSVNFSVASKSDKFITEEDMNRKLLRLLEIGLLLLQLRVTSKYPPPLRTFDDLENVLPNDDAKREEVMMSLKNRFYCLLHNVRCWKRLAQVPV
jgi:hypothetical protein